MVLMNKNMKDFIKIIAMSVILVSGYTMAKDTQKFPEIEALGFKITNQVKLTGSGLDDAFLVKIGADWVFATPNSSTVIKGELIDLKSREVVNSRYLAPITKEIVNSYPEDLKIVYKATTKETLSVINVLTDTSCPYCRKLHKEIPALNAKGIEVRYIPFARGYTRGKGYGQMLSIWCSDDKAKALNDIFSGGKPSDEKCLTQAVSLGHSLATKLDASGTPAIYFENGEVIPGYISEKEIVEKIKSID